MDLVSNKAMNAPVVYCCMISHSKLSGKKTAIVMLMKGIVEMAYLGSQVGTLDWLQCLEDWGQNHLEALKMGFIWDC